MSHERAKGFTIIELMLVVAIMGILATVALPAFQDMVASNRRAAAVNDLLSTVYLARSEAITRNNFVSVCRSNTAQTACAGSDGVWQAGWIIFEDDNFDGIIGGDDETIAVGGPVRGSMVMRSTQFGAHMVFSPQGRVLASNGARAGEILLCEEGAEKAARVVIVDRMGRPRVSDEIMAGGSGDCTS